MKIHLIAVGGAVMHNLAISLKQKGFSVTGSDDEIFEPSKSRLAKHNLLPENYGWHPEKITKDLQAVILGMHARNDNPELKRAQELKIPVYSFPEFIFEQSKNKTRVAVCGSHGKTTITAMVMHALKQNHILFDYLVGAQLNGFETMVQLSDADKIIIEGDEYFASPLDTRPKFLLYHANIALLSGIAWDHFNVFPTWELYIYQFAQLINSLNNNSALIYNAEDQNIQELISLSKIKCTVYPYSTPAYEIKNEKVYLIADDKKYALHIFGKHNLLNMEGAKTICNLLGLCDEKFYTSMQNFKGASRRLEIMYKNERKNIFRDFAHSPSKVKATVDAVKELYPEKKLIACLELHTFSSLNRDFIPQYKNTLQNADIKIVYFNPHTLALKNLPQLQAEDVKSFFGDDSIHVVNNSNQLSELLLKLNYTHMNILLMSSGNFDNLDFSVFI